LPVCQGAHRAQRAPDPLRVVPLYVVIDPLPELLQADALPVPSVEHLVLHGAEEALHPRVVRRAALARHRAGDARLLTDRYPPGPPVVASAVAVDDEVGPLAGPGKPDGCFQHRVGHLGVRRGRRRPAHDGAVEAVQDRGEVELAGGDRELRHVREPQEVGKPRREVLPDLVSRMFRYLARVGAVAPLWLRPAPGLEPLLGHDAGDPALPDGLAPRLELVVDAAPSVDAVIGVEDLRDPSAGLLVPVGGAERSLLVLVARPGHPERREELAQPPFGTQRLNQQGLLPVRELVFRVGARPFSQNLEGALHDVAPELELLELGLELGLPGLESGDVRLGRRRPSPRPRRLAGAVFGHRGLLPKQLALPLVERGSRTSYQVGDLLGGR